MIYELLGASMRAELKANERDVSHRMAWASFGANRKRNRVADQSCSEGARGRATWTELRPAAKSD